MISDKHRCIFIHIQKTAGTSVRRVLKGRKAGHKTVEEHVVDMTYDGFKRYFSFTFVRNPWDRILSVYFQKRQWYGREWYAKAKKIRAKVPPLAVQRKDFNDWLVDMESGKENPGGGFDLFMRGQVYMLQHDGRICVDFVGRFERLAQDWKAVSKIIGVKEQLPSDPGKTGHGRYVDYYEERGREMVERVFADDVRVFGYKFD